MSIYSPQSAYIVGTGSFLPGDPICNDEMENVLGLVNGKASRYRRRILRSNGIRSRHYALNKDGMATHLTEELASEAISQALSKLETDPDTLDMIAVGTTLPDMLVPGIASMVHGRIGGKNADIISTAGVCGAGSAALKAAIMSVIAGQHQRVIACGTERPSIIMRGQRFQEESKVNHDEDVAESYQYFNADFLRWMLSDGAGAFVIDNKPHEHELSLKVEWIETASYANKLPTCMYMGSSNPNLPNQGKLWIENIGKEGCSDLSLLLLRQDTKLLGEHIIDVIVDYACQLDQKFNLPKIDWFLPHISSYFFHEKLQAKMEERGIGIHQDKWFTNLAHKGNTGSASIFIMLDELLSTQDVLPGQKLLLMIPESGRFSVTYALLTAVAPRLQ